MSQGLRSSDPGNGLFSIHTLNSEPQLQYSKEIEQCILTQHLPYSNVLKHPPHTYEAEVFVSAECTSAKGLYIQEYGIFPLWNSQAWQLASLWKHPSLWGENHLQLNWALDRGVECVTGLFLRNFKWNLQLLLLTSWNSILYRPTGMMSFKCTSASNLKPLVWWSKIKYFRKNSPISMTTRL